MPQFVLQPDKNRTKFAPAVIKLASSSTDSARPMLDANEFLVTRNLNARQGIKFSLMSPSQQLGDTPGQPDNASPELFTPPPKREGSGIPIIPLAIAGLVVLVVLVALIVSGRKKSSGPGNTLLPPAAYASNLPISQLAMSESANISGGKYTYIDGHIRNTGSQTVTSVTVQVVFRNDEQLSPQIETQPLFLIRTREPYVDTQTISASPVAPGDDREFRLTFETIPANWNYQMPEIRITSVDTK